MDVTQTAGRANRLDVDDTGVVVTLVDGRRLAARAVVDATGHPAAFGRRARSGLAHQVAYGVVARFDQPPVAPGTMCLMDLDATPFDDLLPVLRRTFAAFSAAERRMIGDRVRSLDGSHTAGPDVDADERIDIDRADRVVPALRAILGGPA